MGRAEGESPAGGTRFGPEAVNIVKMALVVVVVGVAWGATIARVWLLRERRHAKSGNGLSSIIINTYLLISACSDPVV